MTEKRTLSDAVFTVHLLSGPHSVVQQVGGVVRGALGAGQRGLGAEQLRHAGQLAGEAQLVPRPHLPQRRRVPPLLRHQRQLPGAGVRVLARPALHLAALRGPRLPLPHPARPGHPGQLREYNLIMNILVVQDKTQFPG